MLMNGAQIIIECLREQGVDTVFGYPGSSVLGIYDELYKQKDRIRHILTSHEQGAAHAADGYARATGKVGVCIATSGPGATNLVTGIATAYMDSVSVVALTCNVEKELLGKDSFQEVDITGITMPVTKHGFIIKEIEQLAPSIRRAFLIASSGRKGPVILDITKNVLTENAEYKPKTILKENQVGKLGRSEIMETIRYLKQAKRPVILAGGGAAASGAEEEIKKLAELLDAPVTVSLMGKGIFDEESSRYLGMLGMYGTKQANNAVRECDMLLALGIRFSDRMTGEASAFAPEAKILQIDIDPAEINKNIMTDYALIGDIRSCLRQIISSMNQLAHPQWMKQVMNLNTENDFPVKYCRSVGSNGKLTGPYIIERLYQLTNGEAIITTEVGQHQMWAAGFYRFRHCGKFLTSGGLGTMGYGLSAAIGAKLGCPDKTVINIAGDGCFRMNMNELLTAYRHKIPVIQLVFDNQVLGLVYQWQKTEYEGRYSQTEFCDALDFVKLAEALGIKALRIKSIEDVDKVLIKALSMKEPIVIDCEIPKD